MLEDLTDSIIDWADGFGLLGLAIVSATEAAFQPAPPDLLVLPMVLGADNSMEILIIVLVATLSSVLGAIGGYGIGVYAGRPLLERFASEKTVSRLENLTIRYGSAGIFLAAVSPIPYKAFAWAAGAGRMNLRLFILAGLLGRGLRFGLAGLVLGVWGDEFLTLMENPMAWLLGSVVGLVMFIPLAKWWVELSNSEDARNQSL